jgi:hypothetical protein
VHKIFVNILSFWPHYLRPGFSSFYSALDLAKQSSLDGLQVLPVRGLNYTTMLQIPNIHEVIVAQEDAWNYGTWPNAFKRLFYDSINKFLPESLRIKFPEWGTIYDLTFFQQPEMDFILGVPKIIHKFGELRPGYILEVSPRGSRYVRSFLEAATKGATLCIDTRHALEGLDHWPEFISAVDSKSIKIVHVNLSDAEIEAIIKGYQHNIHQHLDTIMNKVHYSTPLVLEIKPNLFDWNHLLNAREHQIFKLDMLRYKLSRRYN